MKNIFSFLVTLSLLFASCSKNTTSTGSSNVPNVTVNVSLSINDPNYHQLTQVGGVVYLTGVGYRGIMIYGQTNTTIVAFDRTCTYDISDANGIVTAQNNGTAICIDCSSVYNLSNGGVNTGPTTIGLKEYAVSFNASTGAVTVTN